LLQDVWNEMSCCNSYQQTKVFVVRITTRELRVMEVEKEERQDGNGNSNK